MFVRRLVFQYFFEHLFIERRAGDDVFFGGPVAQIVLAAALAAEREFGVAFGIGGFPADWAMVFHQRGLAYNSTVSASYGGQW
jgi:hypothetical protein